MPVTYFAYLVIPCLLIIFLIALYKKHHRSKSDQPFEYRHFDLSPEILEGLVKNCLSESQSMLNRYIYGEEDYVDYYDNRERRNMGEIFEHRMFLELQQHLRSTSKIKIWRQRTVGSDSRLDLALFWKDINRKKRVIVIECKHSNSMNQHQRRNQIKLGIEQLYKYRQHIEKNYRCKVDLLVLFTSFPWNNKFPAQLFRNVLVINCYSMLGVFIQEVQKFHNSTIIPPTYKPDDLHYDASNTVR